MKLAQEFSRMLQAEIGLPNLLNVVRSNSRANGIGCASHDFCDPNMIMMAAFESHMGRPYNLDLERDVHRINDSWFISKSMQFFTESAS